MLLRRFNTGWGLLLLLTLCPQVHAKTAKLAGTGSFDCPPGWIVTGLRSRAGMEWIQCLLKGGGRKGPRLTLSRRRGGGKRAVSAIRASMRRFGETTFRRQNFLGRKAVFFKSRKPLGMGIYLPMAGGFVRLAYSAPAAVIERNFPAWTGLVRSFGLANPCTTSFGGKKPKVTVLWGEAHPVLIKKSRQEKPLRQYFRSQGRSYSKMTASASVYGGGGECRLIISLFPRSLRKRKSHIEIRFLIEDLIVESARVKLVTVDSDDAVGGGMDSVRLKEAAIPFSEESPRRASLTLQEIDPGFDEVAANRGLLKTRFDDPDVGRVDAGYSLIGVRAHW